MKVDEHVSLVGWRMLWVYVQGKAGSGWRPTSGFQRNCHADFYSGCTSLHSNQQGIKFPILHSLDNTCLLLTLAVLTEVRGNLKAVVTCTPPTVKDGEHLQKYLSAVCICSSDMLCSVS